MKGVPWEIVECLEIHERYALLVAMGEMESGKTYNFDTGEWPKEQT